MEEEGDYLCQKKASENEDDENDFVDEDDSIPSAKKKNGAISIGKKQNFNRW